MLSWWEFKQFGSFVLTGKPFRVVTLAASNQIQSVAAVETEGFGRREHFSKRLNRKDVL